MLSRIFSSRLALIGCLALAGCGRYAKQSVALYEKGDYQGAAHAAESGLAEHPRDDGLWQMRVRAALALGDADGVAKAYAGYRAQLGEDDRALLGELAIASLRQALESPSVKLKIAAIEAVAAAEIHALADAVAQRMADDDDRVVAAAAVAVLNGFPDAPKAAGDMMRSEDPEARRIAVEGIGKKVGKLALADLEKATDDSDARVRSAAIHWLGQLKDRDALDLLAKRLRDPDAAVRAAAGSALARIGAGNLRELASQALRDRALSVRLAGIELLVAAHADAELARLADDPDPMVAAEAALAARRPEAAAAAIGRAAGASEWTIRAGAANLASRALSPSAARALARRLAADPELSVRLAAARVLAQAGDRGPALAIFATALGDREQRLSAALDLVSLDDPRGSEALEVAVRDPAHGPAPRAAAAAAHRTARLITPGLVAALADDSAVVRVESAAALVVLARR